MTTIKRISRLGRHPWRIVVWTLVLLCLCAPALAFAQTLTGTFKGTGIGRQVAFRHNGESRNNWAGVLRLQLDNGPEVPVFCVQLSVRVRTGDRYRSDGPVLDLPNGCQIRYLLGKYPASTAHDADEAAARQMAIWVFSDNLDPATIEDAKIRDRTIALVSEAQGKPCPLDRTEAPNLALDPPSANASVGQVVSYTIRSDSNGAGQAVTVSVNGPAVFSDANGTNTGQQQQRVALDAQGSATIWVLSTGAGQSTISAALPYRLDAGTVFSQIDDNHPTQRLVMAERQDFVANAAAQAIWAGSAPAPSPSQATATPEAATPAQPTAMPEETPPVQATTSPESTAPTSAVATPTPTRQARRSSPTEQPTAEQPTATAIPEQAPAATPEVVTGAENAVPSPTAGQLADQQAANATAPSGQGPTGAAGATASQPSSLPRTGAPISPAPGLLAVAGLALLGGWMLRRRGR